MGILTLHKRGMFNTNLSEKWIIIVQNEMLNWREWDRMIKFTKLLMYSSTSHATVRRLPTHLTLLPHKWAVTWSESSTSLIVRTRVQSSISSCCDIFSEQWKLWIRPREYSPSRVHETATPTGEQRNRGRNWKPYANRDNLGPAIPWVVGTARLKDWVSIWEYFEGVPLFHGKSSPCLTPYSVYWTRNYVVQYASVEFEVTREIERRQQLSPRLDRWGLDILCPGFLLDLCLDLEPILSLHRHVRLVVQFLVRQPTINRIITR